MKALVLAGQRNAGRLHSVSPVPYEAEIPIRGRMMIDFVLDALLDHPRIDSVRVVGPASSRSPVEYVAPGDTLWVNVQRGMEAWDPDEPVLVATCDIPLLTAGVVDAFVRQAPADCDIVYPVIPKGAVMRAFPEVQRTYVRLREGVFTGGNLFLVRPRAVVRARANAERLLAHRKSPVRLARDVGVGLLFKFITGWLGLQEAERAASRLLDVEGRAMIFSAPEVGVDVDKPSDYRLVSRILGAPPYA